jgi:hypothetical protein
MVQAPQFASSFANEQLNLSELEEIKKLIEEKINKIKQINNHVCVFVILTEGEHLSAYFLHILWSFYKRCTFFLANRLYLITGLILSFIIPALKISIFSSQPDGLMSNI